MVSSVGHSIPISRTSFRLRRMYSWLDFSNAAISGFFLHVGPNQAGAREVLLRPCRYVGEHGLDPLEALVNPSAESIE